MQIGRKAARDVLLGLVAGLRVARQSVGQEASQRGGSGGRAAARFDRPHGVVDGK